MLLEWRTEAEDGEGGGLFFWWSYTVRLHVSLMPRVGGKKYNFVVARASIHDVTVFVNRRTEPACIGENWIVKCSSTCPLQTDLIFFFKTDLQEMALPLILMRTAVDTELWVTKLPLGRRSHFGKPRPTAKGALNRKLAFGESEERCRRLTQTDGMD